MTGAKIFLIPAFLADEAPESIPSYILDAVKLCEVFFVENERSARRYLKQIWKEINIDSYKWFVIHKAEETSSSSFKEQLKENKIIGILSEAGCPGIADPGQLLVRIAQEMNVPVKPLVGPNSIILALMASGMNGQQFQFNGYLPIETHDRAQKIRDLEMESHKRNNTQIFIETPYRNHPLLEALIKNCKSSTRLCIAVHLTGKDEFISTKTMAEWKKNIPEINKKPAIFLMAAD